MPLGYHIVKTAYGRWLPGDERGHWSSVWDNKIGQLTHGGLNSGDVALEDFARARMKHAPVSFSSEAIAAIRTALSACKAASAWEIVALAIEPTHMHLLVTHSSGDIHQTCTWIAQETTKAVHTQTSLTGPVWAKGKWCSHISDQDHWDNTIAYIHQHPSAKTADGIRAPHPDKTIIQPAAPIQRANTNRCVTIVSGGQTGADRAALDFAIEQGIPHGGWCPRGRLAEDGPIDAKYQLRETDSPKYHKRTKRNVRESDATVVFSLDAQPTGGTLLTLDHARQIGKPVLLLTAAADKPIVAHAAALRGLIDTHQVRKLNIAGPRASQAVGIGQFVSDVLKATFNN